MKSCTRCGELLPLDDFYRNRRTSDGLTPHCKRCEKFNRKYPHNPWRPLVENARRRAAKAGESFNLGARDLPPRVTPCPVTGLHPTILCRIDPDVSWEVGNVVGLAGWAARVGVLGISLGNLQEFITTMDGLAP